MPDMIWTLRVSFLLFLAWLIFLVSPFVALYDLAKAVQARDTAKIEQRINFHAVRLSFSRQLLGEYLKSADGQDIGGIDRNAAASAGATVFDPYIEKLVTPQALMDLLQKGTSPQGPAGPAPDLQAFDLGTMNRETLRKAWDLFISSESQGFRTIVMPLPTDRPKDEQFRLTWRLSGTTWRLSGLDLPKALRDELIRRMPPPSG
ncbi:DUF2939 domain-containing protein [Microvirga puerhi]|uniref:DUF2939 domain-containing protein n=1 Tax=Microvirga puerhi TaxID=2876078 RepID=A0ABS7VMY5_9HYPH|nr:DUF2939 domain-containing protein [Microvirga puerhi]MBZ6076387.1 DUF2939 domain-containing protein [Microvirga puerhi]